jgi:F0F1-type ATP synthase membrane subunit c/vacuolar-type H+-ATPase subunit K
MAGLGAVSTRSRMTPETDMRQHIVFVFRQTISIYGMLMWLFMFRLLPSRNSFVEEVVL